MKNFAAYMLALAISSLLFSCVKDKLPKGIPGGSAKTVTTTTTTDTTTQPIVPIDSALLMGDWQIVKDTTTTLFWGLWEGRAPVGKNYNGQPGDYYHFKKGGVLYISEAARRDTEYYKININHVGLRYAYIDGQTNQLDSTYNDGYTVTNLTVHTATLSSHFISPETDSYRTLSLKK